MRRLLVTCLAILALPAFAQPAGPIVDGVGMATLSWQRPTQNTDGSSLAIADIDHYTVYWGEASGNYTASSVIANGSVSSSILDIALSQPTTIFFAMTATHVNGQESAFSNEVAKIFDVVITDEREPNPPDQLDVAVSMTCTTDTPGVSCTITVGDP